MIYLVLKNSANLLFKKLQLLYTLLHILNIWEGAHLCTEKIFLRLSSINLQSSVNRDIETCQQNNLKVCFSLQPNAEDTCLCIYCC